MLPYSVHIDIECLRGYTFSNSRSMTNDPLAPILAYKHFPALERRLHNIMVYIDKCIHDNPSGPHGVIMPEYHNDVRVFYIFQEFCKNSKTEQ